MKVNVVPCKKRGSKLVPVKGSSAEELPLEGFLARLQLDRGNAQYAVFLKEMLPATYIGVASGRPFLLRSPDLSEDIEWYLQRNPDFSPDQVWRVDRVTHELPAMQEFA